MLLLWHLGQQKVSQEFAVSEHLLLLLRISSQWTRQTVEPTWSSAALAKSSDRIYFRPAHLRLLLLALPHFSAKEPHNQTNATTSTTWKKFALAEHERFPNSLIFRRWCKHQTPRCKRFKLKRKTNFSTSQTFPLLSFSTLTFCFQTSRYGILSRESISTSGVDVAVLSTSSGRHFAGFPVAMKTPGICVNYPVENVRKSLRNNWKIISRLVVFHCNFLFSVFVKMHRYMNLATDINSDVVLNS